MRVTGRGNWNVICKVCGFQYKASETKVRWDGLQPVCKDCYETRHPIDLYRGRADNPAVPFVSKDTILNDRVFEQDYDPTVEVIQGATNTHGTRFNVLTDGYLYQVNFYIGGGDDSDDHRDPTTYRFGIWNSGGTLVWSTYAETTPNKWNRIQITPNLSVANGSTYTVGYFRTSDQYRATVNPTPTIAAQSYLEFEGSYNFGSTSFGFPNNVASVLQLIDVSIRPS